MMMQTLGPARLEPAELDGAKPHLPAAIRDLLDPDQLTGQGVTDQYPATKPFDVTIGMRPPHDERVGILHVRQLLGIGARRHRVSRRRRLLPQRLMGALLVVDPSKAIKRALLRPQRGLGRARRLLL